MKIPSIIKDKIIYIRLKLEVKLTVTKVGRLFKAILVIQHHSILESLLIKPSFTYCKIKQKVCFFEE